MEEKLSFENDDILGRKKIAENITRIIENSDEFNVIAIDSSWGTGKTTFIKKWETMLHSEEYEGKFKTLYFNAWKNDYMKDPFAALLTAIDNKDSDFKKAFESVIPVGISLIKGAINVPLKVATSGVLDVDTFNLKDIKKNLFDDIKKEQTIRDKFVEKIEKIADHGSKTIFFIDEIDRCRPTFAIELLETIKHLFKAKNIYFIISVDKIQLSHSIKSLYGEGMDADGYLRRFFDLEFNMPINKYPYIKNQTSKLRRESEEIKLLISILEDFMILEGYSLRDIDKTYGYVKLLLPNLIDNYVFLICKDYNKKYMIILIFAYLINLKVKHSDTYYKIINKNYTITEIDSILNVVNIDGIKNVSRDVEGYFRTTGNNEVSRIIKAYLFTVKEFIVETGKTDDFRYTIHGVNIAEIIKKCNFNNNFIALLEILNDFKINI